MTDYPHIPMEWRSPRCFVITRDCKVHGVWIPVGMRTDGGSVPPTFSRVADPFGAGLPAFLVHDFRYRAKVKAMARKQADLELYRNLREDGLSWLRASTVYCAVRAFGWWSWKKHC